MTGKEMTYALKEAATRCDEERRRWYRALETSFNLPPNCLEGLAPEMAIDCVRRALCI